MKKINLTEKLILYFLVIGILTIVTISWYAYQSGRKAILSRTFDQLTSVRVLKQNQVEDFFSERLIEFDQYHNTPGITNLCSKITETKPNGSAELTWQLLQDPYFTESFLHNNHIKKINLSLSSQHFSIEKNNGNINVIHNSVSEFHPSDSIDSAIGAVTFREINSDTSGSFTLLICKSDTYSGFNRAFSIELNLAPIHAIMVETDQKTGWGHSGESYIVGNDFLMKTPSRFIHSSVQKIKVNTEAVTNGFASGQGSGILNDYRNIGVLSSYDRLHVAGLNWLILAEIDLSEAMAPVNALRNEILFLSIFITFIVFILALIFARSISRPVRKLTVAADRIREGDYTVNIDETTNDEIGILVEAFNAMASQIRQQSRARIDGEDAERQRLSMELHDGLGQWLLAARFRLESADCSRPEVSRQNILETKAMVDNILDEIRRISNNLLPGVLKEFGLESAVKSMVRELAKSTGKNVKLDINKPLDLLPPDRQLYLFRIIQEAINNILKHAEADEISILIAWQDKTVSLKIQDNGKGFDMNRNLSAQGNGLYNMKERTHILGGVMKIISQPGSGTLLTFNIPSEDSNI
ncbi:MAG: HAMP domain-containing protein [Bacteroidales bacterium]